ncbi:MAG: hypothetical protein AVDCRST_MAG19-1333, partial [uncultured Thermomicrobiales bacterium]
WTRRSSNALAVIRRPSPAVGERRAGLRLPAPAAAERERSAVARSPFGHAVPSPRRRLAN